MGRSRQAQRGGRFAKLSNLNKITWDLDKTQTFTLIINPYNSYQYIGVSEPSPVPPCRRQLRFIIDIAHFVQIGILQSVQLQRSWVTARPGRYRFFPFGKTDWGVAPNPNKILTKALATLPPRLGMAEYGFGNGFKGKAFIKIIRQHNCTYRGLGSEPQA